jgi:hypothetical protein
MQEDSQAVRQLNPYGNFLTWAQVSAFSDTDQVPAAGPFHLRDSLPESHPNTSHPSFPLCDLTLPGSSSRCLPQDLSTVQIQAFFCLLLSAFVCFCLLLSAFVCFPLFYPRSSSMGSWDVSYSTSAWFCRNSVFSNKFPVRLSITFRYTCPSR